mgnify:CR=1 FL=1
MHGGHFLFGILRGFGQLIACIFDNSSENVVGYILVQFHFSVLFLQPYGCFCNAGDRCQGFLGGSPSWKGGR